MARRRIETAYKAALRARLETTTPDLEGDIEAAWEVAETFIDASVREGARWAMELIVDEEMEKTHG